MRPIVHTAIIEDDPMVAQINRQYLQQFSGFEVDGIFDNGRDASEYLRRHQPDLAILDVYMPAVSGIELPRWMRGENIKSAVIMVTAATETDIVDQALQLGIVDYLIKPFTFLRFQEAVQKYLRKVDLLRSTTTVNQAVVDRLLSNEPTLREADHSELRKGLNQKTLTAVGDYLRQHSSDKHTCESLSVRIGLSKVTIRRYLNYLIETGFVLSSIDYETGGRPRVVYWLKKQ